jgi:phage terminase small subunit
VNRVRGSRTRTSRLIANDNIAARIAEILAAGAERAEITVEQVLRELAVLGFSDIGKVVRWRPEVTYEELESEEEGKPARQVMVSRVMVVDSETLASDARLAVAEVSQGTNGAMRVKMHDKHGPLVSIGKHLGMFVDVVRGEHAVYGVSEKPMTAEEWKRRYVTER